MIDPAARARLERWKLSLFDPCTRPGHGLLELDRVPGRLRVPLPSVEPAAVAAALAGGAALAVESEPGGAGEAAGSDAGRLRSPLARPDLAQRLVAIRRAARDRLADGGEHALWLGLGILAWHDAASSASPSGLRRAPLALWPVALVREPGGLRLVEAAGVEPCVNPALRATLHREHGAVLPGDQGAALDVAALVEAAEAIAATRSGWRVERAAELAIWSLAAFLMRNDLDAFGDELLSHSLVAQLAAGGRGASAQPVVAAGSLTARVVAAAAGAPHAELIAPLDADVGQLAAVAAAGAGASFVLHGPPGTGKSQTIANLVVNAVAHGKTVLVVSDKAAALDVVQQRLSAIGLGEVCLALYGPHAARAEVVGQLGRVVERAFRPVAGPAGLDARLGELREALDAHAAAMHRTGPFGRSLHRVLGRLVELRGAPRVPLAERDTVGLDRATFEHRRGAVAALAAAAAAVAPVAAHPWRASTLARWPRDGSEPVVAALDEAGAAVAELGAALRDVEQLIPGVVGRTRAQLVALGRLAGLAAASPRPGAELLTHLRLASGDDAIERIALIRARGTGAIEPPRDPGSFLALANRHRLLATEVNDRFTDSITELDAPALWSQLRRWLRRVAPLRYLALRKTRAAIRTAAMPGMLETDGAMVTALEAAIAERAARAALVAAAGPAQRWFGELGGDPLALDLTRIEAAVSWAAELRLAFDAIEVAPGPRRAGDVRGAAWRALVAQVAASPAGDAPAAGELAAFARLDAAVHRWRPAVAALAEATGIDDAELGAGDDHLPALAGQIEALRHAADALRDWVAFHDARCTARVAGIGPAIAVIERGDLGAAELAAAWERAVLMAWADAELAATPALARFHGAAHHAHVSAFADLDRASQALVRARALVGIAERVPRLTADPGGELGVLMHEVKAPRGRPLRQLFAEIPTLLPRLAPCLLASPASLPHSLDPGLPRFDLVVFDEASRLSTADALGALARGHAAVVVGDARQLPPTRGAAADDPAAGAPDDLDELDSLLDDGVAAGWPELRLTCHYRSRHEDLIAFANRRYYADRLQVLPAAGRSPELGIAWRGVDGVLDPGTQQNAIEAAAVAADVIARLRDPAQRARSIAVVALSPAQAALIEDLLDAARADDEDLDAWFEVAAEPVLIKHLETVQGDERDVVLLSVGHARDRDGVLPASVEALSRRGSERRLNVAITRAREQLIVYASVAPEDLTVAAGQGAADLAELLAFARDGGGAARPAEDAPPASPVSAAIARALTERGWTVRHQVGCGAYKLDLAIVDPGDPERYVLAIEHDGAAYAGAAAARDRDRLRPELLGQLGWRVHRIWTLDWWEDPERELARAHGAIIAAVAANRQRKTHAVASRAQPPRLAAGGRSRTASATGPSPMPRAATAERAGSSPTARTAADRGGSSPVSRTAAADRAGSSMSTATASRAGSSVAAAGSGPSDAIAALIGDTAVVATGSAPIKIARNAIPIGPYLAASVPAGRRAPDDLFAPRHLGEVGKIVEQVLAAEAPVHLEVLARRVGAYFGIGRLTQRVIDQVRVALAGRGRWGDEADVVWRLDQDPAGVPPVRVAGQGASARREIHEVPLAEVAAAARIVVERAAGIAAGDLVRDAARLLGFARVSDRVVERVAAGVRLAAQRDLIRIAGGRASLPD